MTHGAEQKTPLTALRGVGGKVAERFSSLGVESIEDLIFLFPRAYQDRRNPKSIASLRSGETTTVRAQVLSVSERRYRRTAALEMMVSDGSGLLVLKWFRYGRWLRKNLEKKFPPGYELTATGRIDVFAGAVEMHHPELASTADGIGPGIMPIYPLTEGVSQHVMRRAVRAALELSGAGLEDPIPAGILERYSLPGLSESVRSLHLPSEGADVAALNRGDSPYHSRIKFDELLFFQLGILRRREELKEREGIPLLDDRGMAERFLRRLPFRLTAAQKRSLDEINADMSRSVPMHRLLQGDVGSGKTVVAFLAMLRCVSAGHQAVMMVPTEVLADQHFRNISAWARGLDIPVALFTGSLSARKRAGLRDRVSSGEIPLIIGTHALVQKGVSFHSVGLAVVDEQHRFGVMQRLALKKKGRAPHFMVMTATPIPRSLALVVYGDLDISTIDEIPPGRRPVQTRIFTESDRARLHLAIAREVRENRQVFIVYPLVEESGKLDLHAATEMAREYGDRIFPNLRVGLLTGRMSYGEKEGIMGAFLRGEYHILVSTTVIEVGVDVPNASLMVVEHAERFGLFQLHQLRGRVGRGEHPSQCVLMVGENVSVEGRERIQAMARLSSGFEIAGEDLRIRGPGDFFGIRQSGMPDFRYAHPIRDGALMAQAREASTELFSGGVGLSDGLAERVRCFWGGKLGLASSG